jgi:hypothetical protein
MKNKRYIRLSKKMKAHCKGNCNGGTITECKYYRNCFHKYILFPKLDSLRYLQLRLKGMKIKK